MGRGGVLGGAGEIRERKRCDEAEDNGGGLEGCSWTDGEAKAVWTIVEQRCLTMSGWWLGGQLYRRSGQLLETNITP